MENIPQNYYTPPFTTPPIYYPLVYPQFYYTSKITTPIYFPERELRFPIPGWVKEGRDAGWGRSQAGRSGSAALVRSMRSGTTEIMIFPELG